MSRYGGNGSGRGRSFDIAWIERWARRVNEDRILPVTGRFFNSRFVLGVDDTEFLIDVQGGKIRRVAEGLSPSDMGYDFALKAPASAWTKFAQPIPPPMFNDIWAMAHPLHRQLVIEGNTLRFWQHLKTLARMLSLMRQV